MYNILADDEDNLSLLDGFEERSSAHFAHPLLSSSLVWEVLIPSLSPLRRSTHFSEAVTIDASCRYRG